MRGENLGRGRKSGKKQLESLGGSANEIYEGRRRRKESNEQRMTT
jgi:hypothetical protein